MLSKAISPDGRLIFPVPSLTVMVCPLFGTRHIIPPVLTGLIVSRSSVVPLSDVTVVTTLVTVITPPLIVCSSTVLRLSNPLTVRFPVETVVSEAVVALTGGGR